MRRHLVFLALLVWTVPAAADVAHELAAIEARQKACVDKDSSTAGMNECTDVARGAADKILNRLYDGAVKRLRAGGDDDSRETLRRLVASERAWIAYRDAQCSFEGTTMLGGSGEGVIVGGCLYQKTAERAKDIDSVLNPQ
jgi:uncharacterized protein YecT (DUF1311 family)